MDMLHEIVENGVSARNAQRDSLLHVIVGHTYHARRAQPQDLGTDVLGGSSQAGTHRLGFVFGFSNV